jgi:hypothetical protein
MRLNAGKARRDGQRMIPADDSLETSIKELSNNFYQFQQSFSI